MLSQTQKRGNRMAQQKEYFGLGEERDSYVRIIKRRRKYKSELKQAHHPNRKRHGLLNKLTSLKRAEAKVRMTLNREEAKMGLIRPTTKNEDLFSRSETYVDYLTHVDIYDK